jgi:hypothetical protein
MTQKIKKKLCWNCEGSASFNDENCPYCGVYLNPLSIGGNEEQENSLFAPPYRFSELEEPEVPVSPFADESDEISAINDKIAMNEQVHHQADDLKSILLPLVFLLSGSILFLFGTALALFSDHGTFILKWNSSYWFFYFMFSIPFLFFGWKALNQLPNSK